MRRYNESGDGIGATADPVLRSRIVELCRAYEVAHRGRGNNIREELTGPLIDLLFSPDDIARKTLQCGLIFDFYYRSKIARDLILAPESHLDHLWEPQTTKLCLFLAQGADHVLVGGAYSGDHALLLAKAILPNGGMCHAFEPDTQQLAMLRHNAELNQLMNIVRNPECLWDRDGVRLLLTGADALAHAELTDCADQGIPTVSIDSYGRQHRIDQWRLIFLDIEGAELNAFRGAERYLAQPASAAPHLIFEIHRKYVDWSRGLENCEIVKYLREFDYHVFAVRDFQSVVPMRSEKIELIPPGRVYLGGPPHGFNMLAVKEFSTIEQGPFDLRYDVSPKLLFHRDPALHQPQWSGRDGARTAMERADPESS